MKNLSLIISLLMIASYCLLPTQVATSMSLSSESPIWTRLSFQMIHASIPHLIVNTICLLTLAFITNASAKQFVIATLISTTIPDAIIADTPTCGISALNFALTGLVVMNSRRYMTYLFINIMAIIPTFWMPHIAAAIHLYCFLMGAFVSFLITPRFNE